MNEANTPLFAQTSNQVVERSHFSIVDKIWNAHVVEDLGDGYSLLHVDRHLIHDLGGPGAFHELEKRGLTMASPELNFAVPDHVVSTAPGRKGSEHDWANRLIEGLRSGTAKRGIRLFDLGQPGQGIVHVIGPELGLSLPGTIIVCGDSHTATHGAVGALAWGIGASEMVHVMATQCLVQKKPKQMLVRFEGSLAKGVVAKDLILWLIGQLGASAGTGYAVEYRGDVVSAMGMEARMTLCNMSIEWGARIGIIAPDDTTFSYLEHKACSPKGAMWERALAYWQGLKSDEHAGFDRHEVLDLAALGPQITWGTSPEHCIAIDGRIPDPADERDPLRAQAMQDALAYMGLRAGDAIAGTAIDRVFIGSCTNGRLSDLRVAAEAIGSGRVADRVQAWVVPGSFEVARQAQAEGLDRRFKQAGFQWREPGCSLCVGANGEQLRPKERSVSTTNRNFVGRQGPGARTHLANPITAAKSAIAGVIAA
ncbi:MAG: 3-isopropylmalate dehydratase large subunit [Betaproteobacteria bacterium]|jgi:3-isopropylmalate/(R)-2-methylmalate dehydratase large subunit|nr:3-isopropylmalate dehydratase large subunit [Betaproteobacteria bacterium]NCW80521.1 3-isopropylmalate dehydratase large subunit [Betaproteobacteria bacterium]NCX63233.1 3-isopropylmalate dehydratase large subunit [Betaproteobacteria bacterium]NDA23571.1 3-isopropylmalate dehydratase large subunit [Betaproteobacteria bacterium]NDA33877.1 3-isopropylmalate dehydratase large subunit [Betaproteobacteria bacterium]